MNSFYFWGLTTALLLTSACAATPTPGKVAVNYDRFSKSKMAILSEMVVIGEGRGESVDLNAIITGGKMQDGTKYLYMTLTRYATVQYGDWRYLQCNHTVFLADDASIPVDVQVRTDIDRGILIESIEFIIKGEDANQLLSARKVEFKVCSDEFMLTPDQIKTLHMFNKKLPEMGL